MPKTILPFHRPNSCLLREDPEMLFPRLETTRKLHWCLSDVISRGLPVGVVDHFKSKLSALFAGASRGTSAGTVEAYGQKKM